MSDSRESEEAGGRLMGVPALELDLIFFIVPLCGCCLLRFEFALAGGAL
jgi:hypothetical protein